MKKKSYESSQFSQAKLVRACRGHRVH